MADRGDIVIVVDLLDPQGRNPKDRACVLVSSPERITEGGPLVVVAITTPFARPAPVRSCFLTLASPGSEPDRFEQEECRRLHLAGRGRGVRRVVRTIGHVPGKQMLQIDAVPSGAPGRRGVKSGGQPQGGGPIWPLGSGIRTLHGPTAVR